MSTYEANIKISFDNFDNENEIMEAINSIHADGFDAFRKNYANLLGKTAVVVDITTSIKIPPFTELDKMTMAKLLTMHLSVDDRQVGLYKSRGTNAGAFYAIDKVLIPTLKQLHIDHLFECYTRAGSTQVLIQDVLGNIVVNFEEVPSMLLELADFSMKLVAHYKAHELELEPYLLAVPDPTAVASQIQTEEIV